MNVLLGLYPTYFLILIYFLNLFLSFELNNDYNFYLAIVYFKDYYSIYSSPLLVINNVSEYGSNVAAVDVPLWLIVNYYAYLIGDLIVLNFDSLLKFLSDIFLDELTINDPSSLTYLFKCLKAIELFELLSASELLLEPSWFLLVLLVFGEVTSGRIY